MPRSAELEQFAREHLKAYSQGDLTRLIAGCTHDVVSIGTDESEWVEGRAALEQALRTEAGSVEIQVDDLTAQTEGSVGWLAGHIRYVGQGGEAARARVTAVARRDNGQWRLVQSHASIGRSSSERSHGGELRTKGESDGRGVSCTPAAKRQERGRARIYGRARRREAR
jgi:ketosteroid isomerase-like protein